MSKKLSLTVLVSLLVIALLATGYLALQTQAAERDAAEAASVSETFYRWYLAYPGNPFAEQAYRESPLVTADFVAEMDAEIEAMRAAGPGGADLVLCAQDIPGEMRYGTATVEEGKATAIVQEVWNPGTTYEQVHEVEVILEQVEGEWLIDDIVCPLP
ncbi:MAG: DUF3828 domain-containing protein [Candidatus Promineifilaceae bacterium]|nr:DUF3828 domain-containing protein [Candidatus Promineifilaceae bacterium]